VLLEVTFKVNEDDDDDDDDDNNNNKQVSPNSLYPPEM
jgi:hypothetical protein